MPRASLQSGKYQRTERCPIPSFRVGIKPPRNAAAIGLQTVNTSFFSPLTTARRKFGRSKRNKGYSQEALENQYNSRQAKWILSRRRLVRMGRNFISLVSNCGVNWRATIRTQGSLCLTSREYRLNLSTFLATGNGSLMSPFHLITSGEVGLTEPTDYNLLCRLCRQPCLGGLPMANE